MDPTRNPARHVLADNLERLLKHRYPHVDAPTRRIKHFATICGVSSPTLIRICSCERATTLDQLQKIASAFDLLAYQLLIPDLNPRDPHAVPHHFQTLRGVMMRTRNYPAPRLPRSGPRKYLPSGRRVPVDDGPAAAVS